ncbi:MULTISPECIES: hypothetical protein [Streptomycetaceae]|uniref:Uncharacterized protein n=1 Tax=Streptantibioticus cattleyicolor (strain ATCC 35852 / DSM 46488 / JCM 4925 / NBRC 14057 / NRRL 8057) TaxID=1003195 RepID=F8JQY3_STREN|nr:MULTISPECIES: hypothetical protein [Streptomycetaceae]AEW94070.1 hypothetical protein SCATT_16990 [Streptantibioticus cattleyicolor NRRL 8057 = DSM 46488]MYS58743.1 hypothetical protein [Streptomyces sp. SID5468]CCB74421.1 protein of unknown function [Streptantibioticus cattleyicolor NRRL 8057 = DSM 46488]
MSWGYEVWVCDCGYTKPAEHDGSCGIWKRTAIHWNDRWFGAFEEAAQHGHAYVMAVPVGATLERGWKAHITFEHIRGGGLCKECRKRRGPLTTTPFGKKFMCEDCRSAFRRDHERNAYVTGRDPDSRLYRPVLDVAQEDAKH